MGRKELGERKKNDDDATCEPDHSSRAQATLQHAEYAEFDEYLEMVLDFGYVTLFAAAMPLASSLTILTNVAEIYLDYTKLHFVCRRPMPVRSGTMPETWFHVISGMCCLAIVTNVLFTF